MTDALLEDIDSATADDDFEGFLNSLAGVSAEEWDEGFACFDTGDYRAGVEAFLKKQKPAFNGK